MRHRWARRLRASTRLPLVLLLGAACHSDGATPPADQRLTLTARTGGDLQGPAGARLLAVPLVLITDAAGAPVSGVIVSLSLVSGTGFTVTDAKAVSGPEGLVRTDVVLGPPGSHRCGSSRARSTRPRPR